MKALLLIILLSDVSWGQLPHYKSDEYKFEFAEPPGWYLEIDSVPADEFRVIAKSLLYNWSYVVTPIKMTTYVSTRESEPENFA